jgi:hypothetical protein
MRWIRREPGRAAAVITVVKAAHSLTFLSMSAAILHTFYSGLTNRTSRWTGVSIAAVIGEALVYLLNRGRCPLTDLVESMGVEHGQVSDIFLPRWIAKRIPILFPPPFAIGLAALGLRRARRQPVVAALSSVIASLFVAIPWIYRDRERRR